MSEETVVETDDVTVSKFFNADDFPVPAVAFDVESNRDEAVTLGIVDEIPEQFGIDQIGFHPEYGSEHWAATGDGVVQFEREVEPGESFTTVYGVRMDDDQDAAPFLSAPTVEVAGDDIDDVVPPESTDVVRELAGGERDTVPGLEDDEESAAAEDELEAEVEAGGGGGIDAVDDDAEILGEDGDAAAETDFGNDEEFADDEDFGDDDEFGGDDFGDGDVGDDFGDDLDADTDSEFDPELDTEEPALDEESTETTPADAGVSRDAADPDAEVADDPEEAAAGADGGAAEAFNAGNVAAALATAIREDEVADEDLETLEAELGGVPQSTEVEMEHLQSRVSELESYADALEAFIDENGTAQNMLGDLESDVEALQGDVASVESDVEAAANERDTLHARVDDVESQFEAVDDLEESLDRLRGDIDALDERLADTEDDVMDLQGVQSDVDDIESDLDDVEEQVEEIDEWRNQLSDVFGT